METEPQDPVEKASYKGVCSRLPHASILFNIFMVSTEGEAHG